MFNESLSETMIGSQTMKCIQLEVSLQQSVISIFLSKVFFFFSSGQKIVRNLRVAVFSSILRQEVAFFDRNRTGELINRLSADTGVVGRSITDNLSDGLRAVAQAAAGVSMMVSTSLGGVRCGGLE